MGRGSARHLDAVVIGAGAAGLFTALTAGQRGRRVLLVDHGAVAGAKILISGGGRCNFTNVDAEPRRYLSANPHFAISALRRYRPRDFIELVQRHGIPWHEKKLGQLFCDRSARDIVTLLLDEAADGGVDLWLSTRVVDVSRDPGGEGYLLALDRQGETVTVTADRVVVATGGLSIPKMGATDFAYRLARGFGLPVIEPRPGLVPFTFTPGDLAQTRDLSGIALDATVQTGEGPSFREALLVTHRGLSGPSILQASSYWRPGSVVRVDLLPDLETGSSLKDIKRRRPQAEVKTVLAEILPRRFAERLVDGGLVVLPVAGPARLGDVPDRDLAALEGALRAWLLKPAGTEGYRTAEVTVGGVDTKALSSKTMEVLEVPGLHFVGEAVDVTGWLGGYNFQWAWSSGWAAGQAL